MTVINHNSAPTRPTFCAVYGLIVYLQRSIGLSPLSIRRFFDMAFQLFNRGRGNFLWLVDHRLAFSKKVGSEQGGDKWGALSGLTLDGKVGFWGVKDFLPCFLQTNWFLARRALPDQQCPVPVDRPFSE